MEKKTSRNLRLGFFVLLGTLFLVLGLYMMGNQKNLFGSTFHLKAYFKNVNGLMEGNEVRLFGINVGTVESVEIKSDSAVEVVMLIKEGTEKYIKKNCLAKVGTDGLMGSKIVNLQNPPQGATIVTDGDIISVDNGINTDEVMRTLNATNENIKTITDDLKDITGKLRGQNSLWKLLGDSVLAQNLNSAIVNIKLTGQNTAIISGDLSTIIRNVKNGKGTIGALVTDTSLATQVKQSVVNIDFISDRLAVVSGNLDVLTTTAKNGQGSVGQLIMDTTFVHNLNQGILTVNKGAQGFSDNMEALKGTWPLRRYYKRQAKGK
ncbi:MAG TPA: MlaD family protein [Bacteroidia bacterium]|nr:MlaD family protein [Bacteroidia bacterium]